MDLIAIPGFSEPFSSLSHLLGAGVFAALTPLMLQRGRGNVTRLISLGVFCFAAVFLLSMSGVYHLLSPDGTARAVLRRLDHAAIFVLIASSFTPVHVILFRGVACWGVLLAIWSLAIASISLKTVYFAAWPEWLGLVLYLGMGWIGLGSGLALWRRYGFVFIEPILFGGLAYSIGAVLEALSQPVLIPGVIQSHEIFHVAVILGLAFHWSFVYSIADGRLTEPAD